MICGPQQFNPCQIPLGDLLGGVAPGRRPKREADGADISWQRPSVSRPQIKL
jgi:hypothetical protein